MWNSTPASSGGRPSSTTARGGACAANRPKKQIRIAVSRLILMEFIPVRLILRWPRRKRLQYALSSVVVLVAVVVARCARLLTRLFDPLSNDWGCSGAGSSSLQAENG